jgi:hypothetical protein
LGRRYANGVITGLVPVIDDLLSSRDKDVDGRDKPGHDHFKEE